MQRDKDFLKELKERHQRKKRKRFRFSNDYITGNLQSLINYFK